MAHLVEHLVSENVRGWTYPDLKRRMKALAVQTGFGEVNYRTSTYRLFLPDVAAILDEALSLFGEMLLTARLTRGIESEKAIIIHEYATEYPFDEMRVWKFAGQQALFENHPRLNHYETALGNPDEVNQCSGPEIQTFYDQYYVPGNLSVVSVGHRSLQAIAEALQKNSFGASKAGDRNILPVPFLVQPPRKQEMRITLSDLSTLSFSQAGCEFRWALPGTCDAYQLWLFKEMLEILLTQELRYERGLTYDVEVSSVNYQDSYHLCISLEVPPDAVEQTQEILWQVLGDMHSNEERFHETRTTKINRLACSDWSGRELVDLAMKDLEVSQRLISFQEVIHHLEEISFSQIVQLAASLTPQRQFRLIVQP
jgi:predicted Zn-dependent peptidase